MPSPLNVPITPPRVAFIDPRTGNVSREWYMFFLSLYQVAGGTEFSVDDLQKGPPPVTIDDVANHTTNKIHEVLVQPSQDGLLAQIAELQKEVQALALMPTQVVQLLSQLADVNALSPTDGDKLIYNGSTGKWEQDSRSYLMLE